MKAAPLSADLSRQGIQQSVCNLIDCLPHALQGDDDLIEHGLESLHLMQLVNHWRSLGRSVTFAQLMELPTLDAWFVLLEPHP